jgi:hypothetical protein
VFPTLAWNWPTPSNIDPLRIQFRFNNFRPNLNPQSIPMNSSLPCPNARSLFRLRISAVIASAAAVFGFGSTVWAQATPAPPPVPASAAGRGDVIVSNVLHKELFRPTALRTGSWSEERNFRRSLRIDLLAGATQLKREN